MFEPPTRPSKSSPHSPPTVIQSLMLCTSPSRFWECHLSISESARLSLTPTSLLLRRLSVCTSRPRRHTGSTTAFCFCQRMCPQHHAPAITSIPNNVITSSRTSRPARQLCVESRHASVSTGMQYYTWVHHLTGTDLICLDTFKPRPWKRDSIMRPRNRLAPLSVFHIEFLVDSSLVRRSTSSSDSTAQISQPPHRLVGVTFLSGILCMLFKNVFTQNEKRWPLLQTTPRCPRRSAGCRYCGCDEASASSARFKDVKDALVRPMTYAT
jgi:hypothetical protein